MVKVLEKTGKKIRDGKMSEKNHYITKNSGKTIILLKMLGKTVSFPKMAGNLIEFKKQSMIAYKLCSLIIFNKIIKINKFKKN